MALPPQSIGLHEGVHISYPGRDHIAIDQNVDTQGYMPPTLRLPKFQHADFSEPDPIGGFQNHRVAWKNAFFDWHWLLFQYPACTRRCCPWNGNFRLKVYRPCETFIMEGAGVVVGDWVEWWSGIGWNGGRGLGGVMVEDWVGDGLGCGE